MSSPRRVVEMRFFGGLNVDADHRRTQGLAGHVMRDWSTAKAWLYRELTGGTLDGR